MIRKSILYIAFLLLALPLVLNAATLTQTFENEYETDAVYLFIINDSIGRDVTFDDDPVSIGGAAAGWSTTLFDSESLVMQGTTIDAFSGSFTVSFWDGRNGGGNPDAFFDFTLEWAEYLDGSMVAQGSIYYDDGGIYRTDDNFTSTVPTPVPASVWMLVSGLALLVGLRRSN